MGCCVSNEVYFGEQLDDYLTRTEVRLAQKSWRSINRNLHHLGVLAFKKFFERQSEMKSLFGKIMVRNDVGDFTIDEEELQNHAAMVMEALGTAVESLEDTSFLTTILIRMGEKHAGYRVEPEMIPLLWPAIREALKDQLGEDFSFEVEEAWNHVFEYISTKFIQGIINARAKTGSGSDVINSSS